MKTNTSKKPAKTQKGFRGYANYEPNVKVKALVKALPNEPHDAYQRLDDLVEGGLRVTLNLDTFNETWQCTVSHVDKEHDNAGVFLVCRGSTWQKALRLAHYAVAALAETDTLWETLMAKQKIDLDD